MLGVSPWGRPWLLPAAPERPPPRPAPSLTLGRPAPPPAQLWAGLGPLPGCPAPLFSSAISVQTKAPHSSLPRRPPGISGRSRTSGLYGALQS